MNQPHAPPPSPTTKRSYDEAFTEETQTIETVYKQTDVSNGIIRLLRLHGGTDPGLRGNLVLRSKDQKYDAVSYTWGSKDTTSQIEILAGGVGVKLSVTPNLEAALRQLRTESNPRTSRFLWVDAICINQDDDVEKSAQVPRMGQVFSQAERVLVWLGKEDLNSSKAINFSRRVLDFNTINELLQDAHLGEWEALFNLLRRPWFSRRWVIQEIALAKKAVVYCGKDWVDWIEFADAVSLFAKKHPQLQILFKNSPRYNSDSEYLGDVQELGATRLVQVSGNLFRKTDEGTPIERLRSLENLISDLSAFEASKPHDTIYAVLALASDSIFSAKLTEDKDDKPSEAPSPATAEPGRTQWTEEQRKAAATFISNLRRKTRDRQFPVDYSKTFFDVCKDFLSWTISRSESLDIICRPWAPTNTDEKLPSWIPTLSGASFKPSGRSVLTRIRADPLVGKSGQNAPNYSASGKYPISWKFGPKKVLSISGFRLDVIGNKEETSHQGIIPFAWLTAGGWTDTTTLPPDRLWRTLVADRDLDGRNPPNYYSRACRNAYAQGVEGDDLNPNKIITDGCPDVVAEFLRRVISVVWMRRMIQTRENKFLGLVPYEAVEGDLICILFGCSVPVVLRKHVEDVGSKKVTEYTFIGECYIHTMMDGGAFRIKEDKKVVTEVFDLR